MLNCCGETPRVQPTNPTNKPLNYPGTPAAVAGNPNVVAVQAKTFNEEPASTPKTTLTSKVKADQARVNDSAPKNSFRAAPPTAPINFFQTNFVTPVKTAIVSYPLTASTTFALAFVAAIIASRALKSETTPETPLTPPVSSEVSNPVKVEEIINLNVVNAPSAPEQPASLPKDFSASDADSAGYKTPLTPEVVLTKAPAPAATPTVVISAAPTPTPSKAVPSATPNPTVAPTASAKPSQSQVPSSSPSASPSASTQTVVAEPTSSQKASVAPSARLTSVTHLPTPTLSKTEAASASPSPTLTKSAAKTQEAAKEALENEPNILSKGWNYASYVVHDKLRADQRDTKMWGASLILIGFVVVFCGLKAAVKTSTAPVGTP